MSNLIKLQQNLQNLAKTSEVVSSYEINRMLQGKLQQVEDRKPLDWQARYEWVEVASPVASGDWEVMQIGL